MKIEIHQTSSPHYWYNNKIGEPFEVTDCGDPEDWALIDQPGIHILKSDCREVKSILGERLSA